MDGDHRTANAAAQFCGPAAGTNSQKMSMVERPQLKPEWTPSSGFYCRGNGGKRVDEKAGGEFSGRKVPRLTRGENPELEAISGLGSKETLPQVDSNSSSGTSFSWQF